MATGDGKERKKMMVTMTVKRKKTMIVMRRNKTKKGKEQEKKEGEGKDDGKQKAKRTNHAYLEYSNKEEQNKHLAPIFQDIPALTLTWKFIK